ncbi:MAG: hypothetical protein M0Q90_06275 [Bacteroidales bacterium]|nr:hypothetical protein [Bacteroidales bacterium]
MLRRSLKIGFAILFSCYMIPMVHSQHSLQLDSVQAFPASLVSVGISIQNATPISSFQLDIPLPESLSVDPGSVILNSSRATDHLMSAAIIANNTLRVICFSLNNTPFVGNAGEVASFELLLPDQPMEAILPIENALLVNLSGQNVLDETRSGAIKSMGVLGVEINTTADSICLGTQILLEALVTGGGWNPIISWSANPSGFNEMGEIVNDQPLFTTKYLVQVNDGFQIAADSTTIFVASPPELDAGIDQFICFGENVLLAANAIGADSIHWFGGNGLFDDPFSAITTYTPSVADLQQGSVWLGIEAIGSAQCDSATDSLLILLNAPPEAEAGADFIVQIGENYQNTDASVLHTDSLFWLSNGDGVFNDHLLLHPIYSPGERDILNGQVSLWIHAIGDSPCEDAVDSLHLLILRSGDNTMQLPQMSANTYDTVTIALSVENRTSFSSFSANILLADGLSWLEGGEQLTDRALDHQMTTQYAGQQLNITVDSPSNHEFSGNNGPVLEMQVITGNTPGSFIIDIISASLINLTGVDVLTDVINGELTLLLVGNQNIETIDNSFKVSYQKAQKRIDIELPEACELQIAAYSIDGKLLHSSQQHLSEGSHQIPLSDLTKPCIIQINIIRQNQTSIQKTLKIW